MKLKVIEVWCKIQKKNWYKIVQINLQGHLSSSLKRPFLFEITLDFIPEKNGVVQQPRDVWMATEPDLYYPLNQREKIAVRLSRADIWPSDFDKIKVKKHFKYHGICVAEVSHYMAATWLKTNSIPLNDWKRRGRIYS